MYFDNLHFLFNDPKYDELIKAVLKITKKKEKKRVLHS